MNVPLLDTQMVVVHANPVTAQENPNPTMVAVAFGFTNSDNNAVAVSPVAGNPFALLVKPRQRFNGPDKIITVGLSVPKTSSGPTITGSFTVTLTGTADDGTVDHFSPVADTPTPIS